MKYYCELGYGNPTFISTEVEDGDMEYRVNRFIIHRITEVYIRLWVGKTVYVVSTKNGFNTAYKGRKMFKLVLGIGSII